jgi:hypothetical protein
MIRIIERWLVRWELKIIRLTTKTTNKKLTKTKMAIIKSTKDTCKLQPEQ